MPISKNKTTTGKKKVPGKKKTGPAKTSASAKRSSSKTNDKTPPRTKSKPVKSGTSEKKTPGSAKTGKKKPSTAKATTTKKKTTTGKNKPSTKIKSPTKTKSAAKIKPAVKKKKSMGTSASRKEKTAGGAGISKIKAPFPAYSGKLPYAFISYSHNDMTEVFSIIKKLKESRYRMWFDGGIEPGNEWPEVVGKAVLRSKQVIVFMSPSASKSRNVRNEINLAFSKNIEIIVVLLKKTTMSEGLRLQIGSVQAIQKDGLTQAVFLDKLKKYINSVIRG